MSFNRFSKNPQILNFMKIRPVENRVPYGRTDGHSDGQTDRQTGRQADMMKLIVAFHGFTNRAVEIRSLKTLLSKQQQYMCLLNCQQTIHQFSVSKLHFLHVSSYSIAPCHYVMLIKSHDRQMFRAGLHDVTCTTLLESQDTYLLVRPLLQLLYNLRQRMVFITNQRDATVRSQFYFTARSLHKLRVQSTPVIRST